MPSSKSGSLTIATVGQCIIKEDVLRHTDPDFHRALDIVRDSDAALTSMEGTILGPLRGWALKTTGPVHFSDPVVLDAIRNMGFNLLPLANNHAFDLGPQGILSALVEASARGLTHAGIGADLQQAMQPGIRQVSGHSVALIAMDAGPQADNAYAADAGERTWARPGNNRLRVRTTLIVHDDDLARLREISEKLGNELRKDTHRKVDMHIEAGKGFDFYGINLEAGAEYREHRLPDPADEARQLDMIRATASRVDHVIVYLHHHQWEPRWEITPDWFLAFAHRCVDAGARMVLSHGTPMLQGIEIYKGAPIFCGLGNFIFHSFKASKYTDERVWQSVIARTRIENGAPTSIELHPVALGGQKAIDQGDFESRRVPHLVGGAYGERILNRLAELSARLGTQIEITDGKGTIDLSARR